MSVVTPISPKEFRETTGMSIYQISRRSNVPVETLKNWFADEGSKRKKEPPPYINNYFGYLLKEIQPNSVK